jgi:hypothetical protein
MARSFFHLFDNQGKFIRALERVIGPQARAVAGEVNHGATHAAVLAAEDDLSGSDNLGPVPMALVPCRIGQLLGTHF